MASVPLVTAGIADLIMSWMLAGIIAHTAGDITILKGMLAAAFIWLGFIVTTNAVNNSFQMKPLALIFIDSGHWLLVLLIMGAVIGGFGV